MSNIIDLEAEREKRKPPKPFFACLVEYDGAEIHWRSYAREPRGELNFTITPPLRSPSIDPDGAA